ncbi:hypothetical protein BDF19DRAFT_460382 [Syncephalis fuscata]|nr:hypothetical protein BDF19DRAFT_460382 [Syncephalis fuscata]
MPTVLNRWPRFGHSHRDRRHRQFGSANTDTSMNPKVIKPRIDDVNNRDYTGCPVISVKTNLTNYSNYTGYVESTSSSSSSFFSSRSSPAVNASQRPSFSRPDNLVLLIDHGSDKMTAISSRHSADVIASPIQREHNIYKMPKYAKSSLSMKLRDRTRKLTQLPLNRLFCKRTNSTATTNPPDDSIHGQDGEMDSALQSPTLITHINRVHSNSIGGRGAASLELSRPDYGPLPYQRTDKPQVRNIMANGGIWQESSSTVTTSSLLLSSSARQSSSQWQLSPQSFKSIGTSTATSVVLPKSATRTSSSLTALTVVASSMDGVASLRTRRSPSIAGTLTTQVGSFVTGTHLWSSTRQPPSSVPLLERPHRPHHQHSRSDAGLSHKHQKITDEYEFNLAESWQQLQLPKSIVSTLQPSDSLSTNKKWIPKHRHINSTSTCASSSISPVKATFVKDVFDETKRDTTTASTRDHPLQMTITAEAMIATQSIISKVIANDRQRTATKDNAQPSTLDEAAYDLPMSPLAMEMNDVYIDDEDWPLPPVSFNA